jgi:hypothetical protein
MTVKNQLRCSTLYTSEITLPLRPHEYNAGSQTLTYLNRLPAVPSRLITLNMILSLSKKASAYDSKKAAPHAHFFPNTILNSDIPKSAIRHTSLIDPSLLLNSYLYLNPMLPLGKSVPYPYLTRISPVPRPYFRYR